MDTANDDDGGGGAVLGETMLHIRLYGNELGYTDQRVLQAKQAMKTCAEMRHTSDYAKTNQDMGWRGLSQLGGARL